MRGDNLDGRPRMNVGYTGICTLGGSDVCHRSRRDLTCYAHPRRWSQVRSAGSPAPSLFLFDLSIVYGCMK